MGGLRRPHGRRNGSRLAERRLLHRRGVPDDRQRAQSEARTTREHCRQQVIARRAAAICASLTIGGGLFASGFQQAELPKQFGASVTASFEGWFADSDGGRRFLVGYYNRNSGQELDIPIGPNNRIEPGGPDLGQPTHFLPDRQIGLFVVPAPAGFKPTDSLT